MKKAFCLALLLALCLICCACGEDAEVAPSTTSPTQEESVPTTPTEESDPTNPTEKACEHEYKIVESVSASCTQTGKVVYQCVKCDHDYQDEQPKLPHNYAGGSCTTVNVCTLCGEAEVEPKGHTYDENKICILCGYQYLSQGLVYKNNSDGTGYLVASIGDCQDKEIVIPKKYQGNPVTGIEKWAFSYCTSLTSIIIPDSVTSIGNNAFHGCTGLTSIIIPDSVTAIGYSAFLGCTSLNAIAVGSDNPVFHSDGNCLIQTAEKTLIIGCANSIVPNDGSVTSIGDDAFHGCSGLTSVTIPASVTSIGRSAFTGCTGLTEFAIPDGVTSIGVTAFSDCTGLTEITIPDSVIYINGLTFYGCTSLTSITIPDNVTSIGQWAFYGCTSLTSITIPSNVNYIQVNPFPKCSSLNTVIVDPNNPVFCVDGNCLIDTSSGKLVFGFSNSQIPTDGSVTIIGNSAFYGCTGLTDVTIPDSVTSIWGSAFTGCTSLTSITIPNSVARIGDCAFYGCTGLTDVTIPDSVSYIGSSAFYDCTSLTSITFNGSKAQWEAIEKGVSWSNNTGDYVIYCTDGEITK